MPLIHSYNRDIAGVVRMMVVSGGKSLRTSRGSKGANVANCELVSSFHRGRVWVTNKFDDLDGHPVVAPIYEQLEQSRSQG